MSVMLANSGAVAAAPNGLGWASRHAMQERVLIVDDHPLVRDGLRSVLAVALDGAEIFEAASFDEAVAIIDREGDFDLVLLDLNLPGVQGFSGLTTLRDRFPAMPVVMVSAATDVGLVENALKGGAAGFIPKSLRRSGIVEAIKAVLAGELYIPTDFAEANRPDPADQEMLRRIDTLTPQQRVVLGLVVAGKLNKQIAYELDVSLTTVKAHVSAVLTKLGVYSRTQAVIAANRVGFKA